MRCCLLEPLRRRWLCSPAWRGGTPAGCARCMRAQVARRAAADHSCLPLMHVCSGPTTVLVLSLLFIAFVVLLHIWGKFRKG